MHTQVPNTSSLLQLSSIAPPSSSKTYTNDDAIQNEDDVSKQIYIATPVSGDELRHGDKEDNIHNLFENVLKIFDVHGIIN